MRSKLSYLVLSSILWIPPALVWSLEFDSKVTRNTKRISGSVNFNIDFDVSTHEFAEVILDVDAYPLTGMTESGVRVLEASSFVELAEGFENLHVIYQRTGGRWPISPRQYILGMWVEIMTKEKVVIQWRGIVHKRRGQTFFGPYAKILNQYNERNVYPAYKSGRWIYNRSLRNITYESEFDLGQISPSSADDSLFLIAPQEILKTNWGVRRKLR